ncbi:DUF6181 family protein [Streptomyces sp. NPDC004549]|uniref:DUF6181 family protein n=1 Tax=Streptomyces sp. NPDC004549 TaxID=3154283 RepID=UPI0033B49B9A
MVRVRSLISDVLTQHGHCVLDRSPYSPELARHQNARRAVRRAHGPRFLDAPDEQAVLADPLREVLAAGSEERTDPHARPAVGRPCPDGYAICSPPLARSPEHTTSQSNRPSPASAR